MRGAWAAGLLMATACGSTVSQDGSGGAGGAGGGTVGTGSTTTGGGGAGGSLPPECAVQTSDPGPYAVTFQFENDGVFPAFLRQDCNLQYEVLSCGDGYSAPLDRYGNCTIDCSQWMPGGCIACEPCPLGPLPLDVGAQVSDAWSGQVFTFSETPDGCSCHTGHNVPAGRYRLVVPVYASEQAVLEGTVAYEVSVNFELPALDGIVRVSIGQSP